MEYRRRLLAIVSGKVCWQAVCWYSCYFRSCLTATSVLSCDSGWEILCFTEVLCRWQHRLWLTTTNRHFIQFVVAELSAHECAFSIGFVDSVCDSVCLSCVCVFDYSMHVSRTHSCLVLWCNEHWSQSWERQFKHTLVEVRYTAVSRQSAQSEVLWRVFKGQRLLSGFRLNISAKYIEISSRKIKF